MNCDEYLARLSTASLDEVDDRDVRAHAAGCAECTRVTIVVAERERHRRDAFASVYANTPARVISDAALASNDERWRDRRFALLFGLAVAGVMVFAVPRFHFGARDAAPASAAATAPTVEEAFLLRCLSSEQAAALVRPHLRTREASVTMNARAPGVLTVRATPAQIAEVRALLERDDGPIMPSCMSVQPATKSP
jgi:hypothetical protein